MKKASFSINPETYRDNSILAAALMMVDVAKAPIGAKSAFLLATVLRGIKPTTIGPIICLATNATKYGTEFLSARAFEVGHSLMSRRLRPDQNSAQSAPTPHNCLP